MARFVSEVILRNVSYSYTFAISAISADKTLLGVNLFEGSNCALSAQFPNNFHQSDQITSGDVPY